MNTIKMLSLYQQQYSFRAIMFSTSPLLVSACILHNITTLSTIKTNKYNIPILSDMIQDCKQVYQATYYGYINSDILFTSHLFSILESTYLIYRQGNLRQAVCLQNLL